MPAAVALGCLSIGGFLAWHYPLAPAMALAAFAAFCVASFFRPQIWLFALPAVLPVIGFAPWTGWLAVEEFDIAVLAAASGAYAALAIGRRGGGRAALDSNTATATGAGEGIGSSPPAACWVPDTRMSGFSRVLIALFAISILIALYRGIVGAATTEFGWSDGYEDAINSVRIAKSFAFALLMFPLLQIELRRSGPRAMALLAAGLGAGLGAASVAIVWERIAFPGLLNFSTDYRATALFWEMHVGGAALDGFLALTAPFVIWPLLRRSSWTRLALVGVLALVAAYACLVTFSRGVYLALPISMGLLAVLVLMQYRSLSISSAAVTLAKACVLALGIAAGAYLVFRGGGYRSLLAVLGIVVLMLPLGAGTWRASAGAWLAAIALGGTAGAMGSFLAGWIPKGNYVIFAVAFTCSAGLVWKGRHAKAAGPGTVALAGYVWAMVAAAIVASGWGGPRALQDTSLVLLALLFLTIWSSCAPKALWSGVLRVQAGALAGTALVAITMAVFAGGAYMGDRFGSSERDMEGRLQHWRDGIGMLNGPTDWAFGKGLGRFPQSYYFNVGDRSFPGSYRIGKQSNGERVLVLYGPRRDAGFGELLRVSQRVPIVPGGQYSVVLETRAPEPVQLHLEICEQHLLYHEGCANGSILIATTGNAMQLHLVSLDGKRLSGGPWYAPRLAFFAMAVESPGRHVEIDEVSLLGPDGREILVNGDFAAGMSRWFFTSDRLHLPWHIKNIGLNVLFDQGLFGLLALALLFGIAIARLVAGRARGHPAAPFLAAALVGFLVVGAFDSLLDVPRLGFLFYLLVLASLTVPGAVRRVSVTGS